MSSLARHSLPTASTPLPTVSEQSRPAASLPRPLLSDRDVNHLHDSSSIDLQDARERALLHSWRAGDRDALGELLESHRARIYALCLGMTGSPDLALDLTQDALVKIILGLPGFAFRSRLSTWITRVVMNVCLSDRRRRRLRRTLSLQTPTGNQELGTASDSRRGPWVSNLADSRELPPDHIVQVREESGRLRAALTRLEQRQRAILILRDGQGLDYSEIAAILEVPEGTVKSRLFRARLALRTELERLEGAFRQGTSGPG